jgi:DNA-cytosine methyltransferase
MIDRLNYIDLFAGCGGLSYGFHNNLNFHHILATDIWEQAKITYDYNFQGTNYILADLSKDDDLELVISSINSNVDILIGGPPCVGFSTLNNSKSHSKQNTLVDQYLKVVERIKPNIFLIENVRGFRSKKHPSGITYPQHVKKRISNFLVSYNIQDFILNTIDYGLAQNRIRYFLLATKQSFDPDQSIIRNFLCKLKKSVSTKKAVLRDVIGNLPKVAVREGADVLELEDGSLIYNHKSMKHSKQLEIRFSHVPKDGGLLDVPVELLTNHLRKIVNGEYGSGGFAKNIYGRMNWNKPSGTIVAGMDKITVGRFVHPDENRLLTPRECARIQSFPDDFIFTGGMVSQYYQIGNAVPPKISRIFANIFSEILVEQPDVNLKKEVCT